MKIAGPTTILLTAAAFFVAGYFSSTALQSSENLPPKCLSINHSRADIAEAEYASKYDTLTDELKARYIFDTVCSASPVIDSMLALVHLRQGGRLSLKELSVVLDEARNRDIAAGDGRNNNYNDLRILIEDALKSSEQRAGRL